MRSLPIDSALPELRAALANHTRVVLQAPPGAGKSTRVPVALLDQPWLGERKILMLEPRRLAARAVATRMARSLGESAGETVGYRTRLETRVSGRTRIEVLTEGILTRLLQDDPALEEVGLVIFDEYHERSVHADLGLALCLDSQEALRDDLRLLVMSATLDSERVATLLGNAPVVRSAGRSFPVEIRWVAPESARMRATRAETRLEARVAMQVERALAEDEGDILVFLPGQGEIRRTQALLDERGLPQHVRVFPLYGELDADVQDAALSPSPQGQRKIVLATNIAETSLTIEGVRVVIDSGLARRARFDPGSGMSRLETVRISRASAEQRSGRAGRLEAGVCYRLWSESEHARLPAHSPPEIVETDLAPLALELAAWGVRDPMQLRWLDPPPAGTYAQAIELLKLLGALDADGAITSHGRDLVRLGTHPRLAHMILRSVPLGATRTAIEIAALLSERDLLRFPPGERNVDLQLRVDALRTGSSGTIGAQVDAGTRQRVRRSAEQLARHLGDAVTDASASSQVEIGRLLAHAYPDRIARSRGGAGRFLLAGGRGARLPDGQTLAQCEFLVIADLDAAERDATIRLAAAISRASIETDFAHAIEARERIEWDSSEQAVVARRERWLGAIKLTEAPIEQPDPARVSRALIAGIREMGLSALPWSKQARQLRERIAFARRLETRTPNPWPDVGDDALLENLDVWLAPWLDGMTKREHLERLDMHTALVSLLDWQLLQRLDTFAPTHLTVPSGSKIPIDYSTETPTVSVRLQEVFGLHETPAIADGRVPLTLELLSPAHRPVQITQDLASFWARGYADVKKDLKGRYPKHYWPDDPLTAKATARTKPRK
ncbi:MAG: ATP-dependent helicase HrpB [Gammaproteobacteria bacterium]|nr:ATP-dependent helicase HrpB [Gammaproteobacteria bacterium]